MNEALRFDSLTPNRRLAANIQVVVKSLFRAKLRRVGRSFAMGRVVPCAATPRIPKHKETTPMKNRNRTSLLAATTALAAALALPAMAQSTSQDAAAQSGSSATSAQSSGASSGGG
ncbi:hypothetical protein XCV3974 [Xanthomonas euvesicatoria pv. vesicatoria str. 85-10]|uniref:Uncharacterized protein n=1 Tax=Xanthomonas euvesicatoria pv. vesicatoria (strain 85-10) TaxID=316273 RepID=Q3BNF8_XANE5|nr:hypothetical protein XCV3974 [Xanthomonas euvesicatoria pv. vesicatoria str. 85-10]